MLHSELDTTLYTTRGAQISFLQGVKQKIYFCATFDFEQKLD